MHPHREIDVISVMVDGRIAHEGSLQHGGELVEHEVQVQRAGGEGFSHNEINPDDDWNRMIQLWILPEKPGKSAGYRKYTPADGTITRVYGGDRASADTFAAKTTIDIAMLSGGQSQEVSGPFISYLSKGSGSANGRPVTSGHLLGGTSLIFAAQAACQLIIVQNRNH